MFPETLHALGPYLMGEYMFFPFCLLPSLGVYSPSACALSAKN